MNTVRYLARRWAGDFGIWLAWRVPHKLVYWCGIRLWANATTGEFGHRDAADVLLSQAVDDWVARRGGDCLNGVRGGTDESG